MAAAWFRIPPWCMAVHDEEAAQRARAWVYLLGAWHAGDDPSTREVRRVTGFGQGRADALVRAVATWAMEAGARIPARVAEQERSRSGAGAERPDSVATPVMPKRRSGVGAASEQERSVSRARSSTPVGEEMETVEEREEGEPEGASLTTPPTSDPDGSVPPADLTSATEAPYAPTTDPTPEHVNETSDGDRAEEGDVPRVVSGGTVGLFGAKWAAALAPEPTPEPKPAPVETVKERNRRERAERAAALAAEVNTVWQAYAARHPHAGRRGPDGERLPSEADAHRIAGAVTEWGTADVLLLLDWAHDAPDDQATWLQGKRGGTAYLGLANLLVADKASGRMDIARQWHAHGRPLTMPGGPTPPTVRGGSRASQNASASLAVLAKMMEVARAK